MNFYGDLPPAQGAAQGSVTSAELDGWNFPTQAQIKTASVKTTKPGNLAFKPRQAAVPSGSRATSNTASVPKSLNVTTVSTTPTPNTSFLSSVTHTQSQLPPAEHRQSPSQFNNNASFDVADAYDPRVPNEYIAYCEERLERKKALRMMEDNRRVMEEAERARAELERQRNQAAQRGDIQSLLMSQTAVGDAGQAAPAGRGRGRGVTNLPAWMTQRLAASVAAEADGAVQATSTPAPGQFQDSAATATATAAVGVKRKQGGLLNKPSCVLLLKNMVGPGEEDDQLGPETQQECGRYGAVVACTVYSVPAVSADGGRRCPDEERVRTFVHFESQESAVRAFR